MPWCKPFWQLRRHHMLAGISPSQRVKQGRPPTPHNTEVNGVLYMLLCKKPSTSSSNACLCLAQSTFWSKNQSIARNPTKQGMKWISFLCSFLLLACRVSTSQVFHPVVRRGSPLTNCEWNKASESSLIGRLVPLLFQIPFKSSLKPFNEPFQKLMPLFQSSSSQNRISDVAFPLSAVRLKRIRTAQSNRPIKQDLARAKVRFRCQTEDNILSLPYPTQRPTQQTEAHKAPCPRCNNCPCAHELDLNQYQATCPLVDREWVCRPPHYSPPRINSISSEYILSFHLSSPMHSQYYSPNHGY